MAGRATDVTQWNLPDGVQQGGVTPSQTVNWGRAELVARHWPPTGPACLPASTAHPRGLEQLLTSIASADHQRGGEPGTDPRRQGPESGAAQRVPASSTDFDRASEGASPCGVVNLGAGLGAGDQGQSLDICSPTTEAELGLMESDRLPGLPHSMGYLHLVGVLQPCPRVPSVAPPT